MRSRRLSFLAGWAALALLAVAGFAAFNNPNPTTEEIQVEAAAASMGHTSGAYAGLAFVLLGAEESASAVLDVTEIQADPDLQALQAARTRSEGEASPLSGLLAGPGTATGWLSEVEVRSLANLYFEPTDVNRAVRVAWCESRFDPQSVNLRTGGIGLYQHLPKYWTERAASAGFAGYEPTDAEASTAAAAWAVYNGGGWDVFACGS